MQTTWQRLFLSGLWAGFLLMLLGTAHYYNWSASYASAIGVLIWILLGIFTLLAAATTFAHLKNERPTAIHLVKATFLLVIISGAVHFCFFAKGHLYDEEGLWLIADRLQGFLALWPVVLVFCAYSWVMFQRLAIRLYPKERVRPYATSLFLHAVALFVVQGAALGLYIYAFYPGIIAEDMLHQWGYVAGDLPYTGEMTPFYGYLLQAVLSLWHDPFAITALQIAVYLICMTAIFTWLLDQKMAPLFVYSVAFCLALWPQTGIQLMQQGPQVLFYISLLWLSFVLLRIGKASQPLASSHHLVILFLAWVGILLFDAAGWWIFWGVFLWILLLVLRQPAAVGRKKGVVLLALGIVAMFLFTIALPQAAHLKTKPASSWATSAFQGYAAIYKGKAEDFTYDVPAQAEITAVASAKDMRRYYHPYMAEGLSMNVVNFSEKLAALPNARKIDLYATALQKRPDVVLGDRFNLTVSLWSVSSDPYSEKAHILPYITDIDPLFTERFSVERSHKAFTSNIENMAARLYQEQIFLSPILWRPALGLVFYLILVGYSLCRCKTQGYLWPLGLYAVVIFFTMTSQYFRLLWCFPLFAPILLMLMTSVHKRL